MHLLSPPDAVHIEICCKQTVRRLDQLEEQLMKPVQSFLNEKQHKFNMLIEIPAEVSELYSDVESILLEGDHSKSTGEVLTAADLERAIFHFYRPHRRNMELEMFEDDGDLPDSDAVPSSNHWLLPSAAFVNLWENLIYEDGLKEKILKFALSALTFSQHCVNQNIVACNRLILLHGPPGTGKTSLCKAIAQKLSVRIRPVYKFTHLIEINSHSLFSKWFSESGKLVMKLFAKIREIIAQPKSLVCVLIDEVESLAYARDCMSAQEPKDAMRVVNALLTQLDTIKEYPNVLILATSNLAKTIDIAFLDRADIKQYIGLPSPAAIRQIYSTMLIELMRVGILEQHDLNPEGEHEDKLSSLAEESVGLSGRALRKLPFLAHAVHTARGEFGQEGKITLNNFLDAMLAALEKHKNDHDLLSKQNKC